MFKCVVHLVFAADSRGTC